MPISKKMSVEMANPIIFAIVSHRGGVGKTILAVNIALELAQRAKVLLVDATTRDRCAYIETTKQPRRSFDAILADSVLGSLLPWYCTPI